MFCPNCASRNDDSQHYCRSCGLKLDAIAVDVATQRPSPEVARLLERKKRIEVLGKTCLGLAGLIGFMILVAQVFYEKLKVLGPDLLFGGASIAVVIFTIAAGVFLSYPKLMMKFEKLNPLRTDAVGADEPRDTNKLLADPPFGPASVTEHTTEFLKTRK